MDAQDLLSQMIDWSWSDVAKNKKSDWSATFRNWARKHGKEVATRKDTQRRIDERFAKAPQDRVTEHDRQYMERQRADIERRNKNRELYRREG